MIVPKKTLVWHSVACNTCASLIIGFANMASHADTSEQTSWLDGLEEHTSKYLNNQALRLDSVFAGGTEPKENQASLELKVIPVVEYSSLNNTTTTNLRLRAKLNLPNTSQRLKLFIDNDSESTSTIANGVETTNLQPLTDNTNVGIGWWLKEKGYDGFVKLGIRSNFALDSKIGFNKHWGTLDNSRIDWQTLGRITSNNNSSAHSLLAFKHPIRTGLIAEYNPIVSWNREEDGVANLGNTWSLQYLANQQHRVQVGYTTRNLIERDLSSPSRQHAHWLSYQYTFSRPWIAMRFYAANIYGTELASHWVLQNQVLMHIGKRR
jgi:hypothetical protein